MRNSIKINSLLLLFMLSVGLIFTTCDQEKIEYGEALIYMPQATTTGGVNTLYSVPSGGGEMTYNFKAEDGKINIMLGVVRSGTFEGEDYSVDIVSLKDQTDQMVASGQIRNAVAMPDDIYSLPTKITTTNSREATFFLSVDSTALINDLSYTGQNMVLAVGIANPTNYALSEKNTVTIVVLDIDAIRDHYFRYKEGFVYRKGTQLFLNGKDYKSASFNAFSLSGCGASDEIFSISEIDALFASLPNDIMVRTWAFSGSKAHTDQLIKLAEKNNIKLVLSLGDGLSSCNEEYKTAEWYTSGFKGEYLTHVKDMAATYKDSPAIGMWEIINRPINVDWQIIKSFMNEVGKAIKDTDPNHLVSSGTWAHWAYGNESNFQQIHNRNYIDVGTLQEGDADVVQSWHFTKFRTAMNNVSKASMIADIEIEGGDNGCMYTRQGRMEMVKKKYDLYLDKGASVVMVSALTKTTSHCNTFSPDDPLMDMIKAYSANNR